MIQVDTLCHKIPNFIEKSKRAGVTRVFIGLENVNPDNLTAAKKNQIVIRGKLEWRAGKGVSDNQRFLPLNAKVKSGATVKVTVKSVRPSAFWVVT